MKFNKLNYEAFMIDYLEGSLSQSDKLAFDQFLAKHPKIKSELTDYLEAPLMMEDLSITYTNKEKLYQPKSKKPILWISALVLLLASVLTLVLTTYSADKSVDQKTIIPGKTIEHSVPMASLENQPTTLQSQETKDTRVIIDEGQSKAIASEKALVKKSSTTPITAPDGSISRIVTNEQEEITLDTQAQSFASASVPQEKVPSERVITKAKKNLQILASVDHLPQLKADVLASTEAEGLISETAVMTIVLYESKEKKNNWWASITPQAYKNINLRESFGSIDLKTAAEGFENMVLPKSIITN